jgi:DNA gyrase inhibitor GyrI
MEFEIEMLSSRKVVYIRQVGPYGADNVETMERLKSWASANQLLGDDSVILGIAWDDPQITKPEDCRYDTCLVVPGNFSPEGRGVLEGEMTGGRHAVFKINHTAEAVQKAWSEIFPQLAKRNLRPDSARPIMERYAARLVREHFCEICVPIL